MLDVPVHLADEFIEGLVLIDIDRMGTSRSLVYERQDGKWKVKSEHYSHSHRRI